MNKIHLILAIVTLMLCGQVSADDAKPYHIPAQPLNNALLKFSAVSGVETLYAVDKMRGLNSNALEGSMTSTQALSNLLQDSGMAYRFVDAKTVTVEQPDTNFRKTANVEEVPEPQSSSDTTLPKVTVEAEAGYAPTDPYNPDYTRPNASSATKTDTPIMETPFSIKVLPQQVLRDQQVVNIRDSFRNVAGVVPFGGHQNVADSFISRGFRNDTGVYRDGYSFYDQVACCPTGLRETANVERIEFLKGPASILFGRTQPGGIINLVTKQPLATPYYSLQQQIGSYDFYRTTLDATGPLTSDDTLLYRFNMAYQDAGSFREFVTSDRVFVAPKLRWNISPRTQVTLDLEYMHNEDTPDIGNVPLALNPTGNKPSSMPINRNIGEEWSTLKSDRVLVGLDWSHQFNDDWALHHRFNTERFENKFVGVYSSAATPDGTVQRGLFNVSPSEAERYSSILDLTGKFETWGIKHTLLAGGDYFKSDERTIENDFPPGGQLSASNIFNPSHQSQLPQVGDDVYHEDYSIEWYGLYLQDQIELPYNIHVLGGFRYDNAEVRDNLRDGIVTSQDDKISPRGGLVWHPVSWLSLYGSYTENFGAANGQQSSDGTFLPSQTAQQWEAGLKTEFWNGRFTSTFAYFDLTRQNQRTTDPANPTRATLIGEAQSRGVEFETTGEFLPGWKIITAYSYIPFAEVTKGNELSFPTVGTRFNGVPEHSGSLWSTYEFQSGSLKGLTFGAGMVAVGERVGNNANTYTVPGYATMNLMGRYAWNVGSTRVSAQLNVDNLLDKTYALGTNGNNHIPFGNPLTLMGSLRVEY